MAAATAANCNKVSILLITLPLLLSTATFTFASDPSPLRDFCVPLDATGACKDVKQVQASDFSFSGLDLPGNATNRFGFSTTSAVIPGLNTLGLSLLRADLGPAGVIPPHLHPRATEIVVVLDGTIQIGFVTSYPENRLIGKVLSKGDVFVVPQGLVHIVSNPGNASAVALAGFSSQNPGFISVPSNVFGSTPDISTDLLARSFQVDNKIIEAIQSQF